MAAELFSLVTFVSNYINTTKLPIMASDSLPFPCITGERIIMATLGHLLLFCWKEFIHLND